EYYCWLEYSGTHWVF
nr:immunoglobulin light chain junction region [Macaca mulatta]